MWRKKRFGEETVVKEKTKYLPVNPGNGAYLRYTGDERSDTDEDHCRHEVSPEEGGR